MSLIPKDAKGFEKAVYVFVPVIAAGLLLFMYLSAFGVFHNFYSEACKLAGWGWKIPGIALLAFAVWYFIQLNYGYKKNVFWFYACIVLSLLSMAGFATPYFI